MTDAAASDAGISPSSAVSEGSSNSAPAEASASEAPAIPSFKGTKHKVKIGGVEKEVDYDSLITDYQTRQAADVKFREAADLMKQAGATKAEIEAFKKNPIQALKDAGVDKASITKFAEDFLLEHIEYESLSPAEKRAIAAEEKAKRLEEELSKTKLTEKQKAQKEEEAKAVQEIDQEIGAALKAMGRRPTPRLIARVAETLIADYERQLGPLRQQYGDEIPDEAFASLKKMPAGSAVEKVQKEYVSDIVDYIASLPIEEVRKILPKTLLDGLRQAEVNEVLSQDPVGSRKPRNTEAEPIRKDGKQKRMTSEEFFKLKEKKWG